jgi:hypothetical protein
MTANSSRIITVAFALACFVAAGVCLIVNLAVSQQLTWAAYPLVSITFGWAVLSPLALKRHGIVLSLGIATLFTFPYLYLLGRIVGATEWLVPIGIPASIAGIGSLWVLFCLFRLTKLNVWYKSAVLVFVIGVVTSTVVNYFVDSYAGQNPFTWDMLLTVVVATTAAVVLGVLGYLRPKPHHAGRNGS